MLDRVDKVFTWMIYTHVLNKPGIGVRSPLDWQEKSVGVYLGSALGNGREAWPNT
jgi:hypothetical protein